jgi:hypothetical protein
MVRQVSTSHRYNGRAEYGPLVIVRGAQTGDKEAKRDRERTRQRKKRKGKRGKSLFGD